MICDKCSNRVKCFDEYIGECVKCVPRKTFLLPEPLQGDGIDEVLKTGKCEFHNKDIYFDEDGFPKVKETETSRNLGIYD